MARDKVIPFLHMIEQAVHEKSSTQAIIEAMRIFGYINEMEYSELNTAWTKMTQHLVVRSDGAETIELARGGSGTGKPVPLGTEVSGELVQFQPHQDPDEIPGMIPREY